MNNQIIASLIHWIFYLYIYVAWDNVKNVYNVNLIKKLDVSTYNVLLLQKYMCIH